MFTQTSARFTSRLNVRSLAAEVTARKSNLPFFAEPIIFDSDLATLFLNFHNASAEAKPQLEQETLLLLLMAKLITRYADDRHELRSLGAEREGIRGVREYLQENYAENVSLERLAAIAGLSRFHLLRVFRKEVGLPPHKYQIQVRVERAKLLLAKGVPVGEAALAVGFVDQSHMTRHFRRLAQVTPGRYIFRG